MAASGQGKGEGLGVTVFNSLRKLHGANLLSSETKTAIKSQTQKQSLYLFPTRLSPTGIIHTDTCSKYGAT